MKNNLKKIIAAVLAAGTLALTGCGSGGSSGGKSGADNGSSAAETGGSTADNSADSANSAASGGEGSEASHPTGEWDELDQNAVTKAMGMGWNLGNSLEASVNGVPSETSWNNPTITPELLKSVKEAGFSTVRIPVSYLQKIGKSPDYTIDKAWLDRIQEVVDYVVSNDMFAIINMHGDGYYTVDKAWLLCMAENQEEIREKYRAVWRQIAERFKDYDEHLIFESMNEEFDNTYGNPKKEGYKNINAYNQVFVDTVRQTGGNNDKRWLLMPGWNTNIDHTVNSKFGFEIPADTHCTSDGKRIMISVHYYDPYNFTIDENKDSAKTQWGKYAQEDFDNWGQEDHADNQMKKLKETFVDQGYPVVIGELGVQDKTHLSETQGEFKRYWYEYIIQAAKQNGCVPVYWDNGWAGDNGFALFDRNTAQVLQPDLIAAIMKAINSDKYDITPPKGFETPRAA